MKRKMTRLRYLRLWLYYFVTDWKCVLRLHRECEFGWLGSLACHWSASAIAAWAQVYELDSSRGGRK